MDQLSDELRYRPDGYMFAPSFERYKVSGGTDGWDGFLRPFKRIDRDFGKIHRGRRVDVMAWADEIGETIQEQKPVKSSFSHVTEDDVPADILAGGIILDHNQRECIASWLKHGIGINQMSVSSGKTATLCGAACMIKRSLKHARFLYVTPAERLVRQVYGEAKKFLPEFEIGQYGGGKQGKDAKDLVVCTTAMLTKHFKELEASGWFKSFFCTLVEESFHASSKSTTAIMEVSDASYRFGCSDIHKHIDPTW